MCVESLAEMDRLVFSNAAYIQSDKLSFNVLSSGDPKTDNHIKLLKSYLLITIYEYFLYTKVLREKVTQSLKILLL